MEYNTLYSMHTSVEPTYICTYVRTYVHMQVYVLYIRMFKSSLCTEEGTWGFSTGLQWLGYTKQWSVVYNVGVNSGVSSTMLE